MNLDIQLVVVCGGGGGGGGGGGVVWMFSAMTHLLKSFMIDNISLLCRLLSLVFPRLR